MATGSGLQDPTLAIAHDPAGGRIAEMAADHQHLAAAEAIHESLARLRALVLVHVEVDMSLRIAELERMMHQISRDDRLLTLGADQYTDVSRRVSRRGEQRDFVRDRMLGTDEVHQTRHKNNNKNIVQKNKVEISPKIAQVHPKTVLLLAKQKTHQQERGNPQ